MISRLLEKQLTWLGEQFSLLLLSGPQGSGKTTLARHCFKNAQYMGFKNLETRRVAFENPSSFLHTSTRSPLTILDDIDAAPHLLSHLTQWEKRQHQHVLLISNSQSTSLNVSKLHLPQVRLWPLSTRELGEELPTTIDSLLFQGGYPEIYAHYLSPHEWYQKYVRDFIERELPCYKKLHHSQEFQHFLAILPRYLGEPVNLSTLGAACNVTYNTAKAWLALLEDLHWIILLPPYPEKQHRRTVRSPKLYFVDSGLLCYLAGIKTREELREHPLRANIFTSFVISDLIKQQSHFGYSGPYYFWKDKMGKEVQLVLTHQKQLFPIQISPHSHTPTKEGKCLSKWKQWHGSEIKDSWIVYTGNGGGEVAGARLMNWTELAR